MDMNNTADAERQEKDRRIVSCMHEMQGDVDDLVNMSVIMADLLDSELRACGEEGGCVTIKIGRQHFDMCSFAWNDVVIRANAVKKRFLAALDGEVQS